MPSSPEAQVRPIRGRDVKARLVKVLVSPIVVVDDGQNLTELPLDPIEVQGKDWPAYPAKMLEELELRGAELAAKHGIVDLGE